MKLMTMGRVRLVDDEDGRPKVVEFTGLIIKATPRELVESAPFMLEDVSLQYAAPADDGANLLAGVSLAMDHLRQAVAALREKHGRDVVRSLPWGLMLDAMDSGRTELHPDDVPRLAEVA